MKDKKRVIKAKLFALCIVFQDIKSDFFLCHKMEKQLSEIINSLNRAQARRFREMFERQKNPQIYFKLFNLLQNSSVDKIPNLDKKFKSPSEFTQAKSDLFLKLLTFFSIAEDNPQFNYEKLKWAWEYLFEREHYELAAKAIRIASRIVQRQKYHTKIFEIQEAEESLPIKFQPSTSQKFNSFARAEKKVENNLSHLEKRYAEWSKMIKVPPPSIPALEAFEQDLSKAYREYLEVSVIYQNPFQRMRFLSMHKKTLALLGRSSQAHSVQKKHLGEIESLDLPKFKKEVLLVNEYESYCGLLLLQERHNEFRNAISRLTTIRYSTPRGKALAQMYHLRLKLAYYSDFGITTDSKAVVSIVPKLIQKYSQYLTEGKLITLKFLFGRYQFMLGDLSSTNQLFSLIFEESQGTKAYFHYFPYVTLIQILLAFLQGKSGLAESKSLSLQRFLRNENIPYKYFDVLLRFIRKHNYSDKNPVSTHSYQELALELDKLKSDSFESFPFNFFNLDDFARSKAYKTPFSVILQEKIISSENEKKNISGGNL